MQITLTILAVLCLAVPAAAQVAQGKTRPLQTKTWMKTVNGPQCSALGKAIKAGPADDKAWAEITGYAQMLDEAGHVLMADGRCPDKVWADASKQLREGAEAVLKAAAAKNATDAQAAFSGSVLASCKACHAAHKK